MTIEEAIKVLYSEYERALNNPQIKDPVSWAMYHAWRTVANDYERRKKRK